MSTLIDLDAPIKGTPFDLLDPVTGERWIARPVFTDSHDTRAMWMIHIPKKGGKPEHRLVSSERMPRTLRDWLFQWDKRYSRTVTGCKLRHVRPADTEAAEHYAQYMRGASSWYQVWDLLRSFCDLAGLDFREADAECFEGMIFDAAGFWGVDVL